MKKTGWLTEDESEEEEDSPVGAKKDIIGSEVAVEVEDEELSATDEETAKVREQMLRKALGLPAVVTAESSRPGSLKDSVDEEAGAPVVD